MKRNILYAIPLFASCLMGCTDWDDHYTGNAGSAEGADATLWQQLKENPSLSDFCQVLEETKVFRQHKKTPVSYAQLLDGGQAFTVIAPVNGTFDKEAILEQVKTAQGDSVVEKSFVQNHLSRLLTSVTPDAKRMLLLNSKYADMEDGKIEGVAISHKNQVAKNGVIHVVEDDIPYERNLYEALCDDPDLSLIGVALRKYEKDEFNADASVSSGIVEGVPVYIDSVITERNLMLEGIGYLNREDSLYWVVAPTEAGWKRAWDEASSYFRFHEKMLKADSLQHYWTTRALMEDAIFNITLNSHPNDSLMSVPYVRRTVHGKPVYHVFHKPFEAGGILSGAVKTECSNGVLYKVDEWPFTIEQNFFRELWVETENEASYIFEEKGCFTNSRRLVGDSISEDAYLQILHETATSNWEVKFRVNNTLSGYYDIYAIVLPKTIQDPEGTFKPNKFKVVISYLDEKGNEKTETLKNKQFQNDPTRVDTIMLAESFYFPACNYGQNNNSVSVKLQCSILPKETSRFEREMYLDCIYLKPKKVTNNE